MMSGGPVCPNPSMPQTAQVDGRNCIGPSAPAGDGPTLVPSLLSIWPMAASTVQDSSGQYLAADSWNSCRYVAGFWLEPTSLTGSGCCCWRRLMILLDRPRTWETLAISVETRAAGALISAATRCTRPSSREVWVFTSRSTPVMPKDAVAPDVSAR